MTSPTRPGPEGALRARPAADAGRYVGVDFGDDGSLVVAERQDGCRAGRHRYGPGPDGIRALRAHLAERPACWHVCVRACGAAALAVVAGLLAVPRVDVTLVAPRSLEMRRPGDVPEALDADERAERLARRAERLF